MKVEDLPPDIVIAIVRFAKRKTYDTKWSANVNYSPELEAAYLKILYNAFIIGALKGYDLGINGAKNEDE